MTADNLNSLLPITYEGRVVHGRRLGRTIDMPTANIYPEGGTMLPFGVYYSRVFFDGTWYKAISNIGTKPTVQAENLVNIETYLYDFDGDLYDRTIRVELLAFKRPEMKFASFEDLTAQMHRDMAEGRIF